MMVRGLMIGAALSLAACGTGAGRSFDDPAVQKLFNMPTPQYFATISIASKVAQNCAGYAYDSILDSELNARRNEVGRGTLSAISLRRAIESETSVSERSFMAKHGVEMTGTDLCPAGDAEVLENSAISALLIPV